MEFDPTLKTAIRREFIEAIKEEGLLLVPYEVGHHVITIYKRQQSLMKQKAVTPYQIANYKLIPGITSIKTIRNWIDSGKIRDYEWYMKGKKYYVLTEAVRRLND